MRTHIIMKIVFFVFIHASVFASGEQVAGGVHFVELAEQTGHSASEQRKENNEQARHIQRRSRCNRVCALDCGKGIIIAALIGGVLYGAREIVQMNSSDSSDSANISPVNTTANSLSHEMHLHSLLRRSDQLHVPQPLKPSAKHTPRANKVKSDKRYNFIPPVSRKSFNSKKRR